MPPRAFPPSAPTPRAGLCHPPTLRPSAGAGTGVRPKPRVLLSVPRQAAALLAPRLSGHARPRGLLRGWDPSSSKRSLLNLACTDMGVGGNRADGDPARGMGRESYCRAVNQQQRVKPVVILKSSLPLKSLLPAKGCFLLPGFIVTSRPWPSVPRAGRDGSSRGAARAARRPEGRAARGGAAAGGEGKGGGSRHREQPRFSSCKQTERYLWL